MASILGENRYGKSRVRLMKVTRDATRHHVAELNVEVWLEGDFQSCFEDGDNSKVLPTDTMKNTVYSLARASQALSIEGFAIELVDHFIHNDAYAQLAGVRITSVAWEHIASSGESYPTAFTHGEDWQETTIVTRARSGEVSVTCGFQNMWLLKTAKSGFSGFLKDRLTTLKETSDRLFGTLAQAEWRYENTAFSLSDSDFQSLRKRATAALIRTFAAHDSFRYSKRFTPWPRPR